MSTWILFYKKQARKVYVLLHNKVQCWEVKQEGYVRKWTLKSRALWPPLCFWISGKGIEFLAHECKKMGAEYLAQCEFRGRAGCFCVSDGERSMRYVHTISADWAEREVSGEVMLALAECSACVMELLMAHNSTHSTDTADVSCIYRLPIIDGCQATDGGAQRFHDSTEKSLQILLGLRAPVGLNFKLRAHRHIYRLEDWDQKTVHNGLLFYSLDLWHFDRRCGTGKTFASGKLMWLFHLVLLNVNLEP